MEKTLQKYIGRTIEIIYLGSDNQITQRYIKVRSVKAGLLKPIASNAKHLVYSLSKTFWPCSRYWGVSANEAK